jgi:hypothetical protein
LCTAIFTPGIDKRDEEVYRATVEDLTSMYAAVRCPTISQNSLQRLVGTMPGRLPKIYLELLDRRDPSTLALHVRNVVLLGMIEPIWWLHRRAGTAIASRVANGVASFLPPDWLWTLEWPHRALSGEFGLQMDWPRDPRPQYSSSLIQRRPRQAMLEPNGI